jgi:hypothetical protein
MSSNSDLLVAGKVIARSKSGIPSSWGELKIPNEVPIVVKTWFGEIAIRNPKHYDQVVRKKCGCIKHVRVADHFKGTAFPRT